MELQKDREKRGGLRLFGQDLQDKQDIFAFFPLCGTGRKGGNKKIQ
jgi:hypothetical protein